MRASTPGALPTCYTYTGQYSYVSDDATGLDDEAGFGLMYYGARWYDGALGRMIQADSVVPGGMQGLDRYAYANNSPVVYSDPSGHWSDRQIKGYLRNTYGKSWKSYYDAWKSDNLFWEMLLAASDGDELFAPESGLESGTFHAQGETFTFEGPSDLYEYQGKGPYRLAYKTREGYAYRELSFNDYYEGDRRISFTGITGASNINTRQPIYDYSTGTPLYTGNDRVIYYSTNAAPEFLGGSGIAFIITGGILKLSALAETALGKAGYPLSVLCWINNGPMGQEKVIGVMTTSQASSYYGWSDYKQTSYRNYNFVITHGQ